MSKIVGKQLADVGLGPEVEAKLEGWVERIFATGERMRDEVYYVAPDGTLAVLSARVGTGARCRRGVELIVGVSRFTTERRKLEERLAGYKAPLNSR
ncbi:MAG TPA: hypothetical protein VGF98_00955 [Candidatus Tumulicola sp.]